MGLPLNAMTLHCRQVLYIAAQKAEQVGQHYVGTEHLLWALTSGQSAASQILDEVKLRSLIADRAARQIAALGPSEHTASNSNDEITIYVRGAEAGFPLSLRDPS